MLRSVPGSPRAIRLVAVIVLIMTMLCVSAASVSPSHTHLNEPVDRCDVCYTAHLAAQQVAVVQVIHSLEVQSFLPPSVAILHVETRDILALLPRGPPSFLNLA